jgi:paraquat-inducible protein A
MKQLTLLLLLVLICALLFSGWKAWEQAVAYEDITTEIIERLDTDSKVESTGQRLLEWLSLGSYTGYSDEKEELLRLKQLQHAYGDSAWLLTGLFFALALPAIGLAYAYRSDWCDMAYAMLGISIIALVVGLLTPILVVSAQQDIPVIGETVFQFQSRGIVSTIVVLKQAGNWWLALLLFLFSVLIPITKTLLVTATLFARDHHLSVKGLNWSRNIGKWSMTDVFVVAILVVFFANEHEGLTQAEVQVGLCFFAGYVVLSLLGTSIISRHLSAEN